jgi:hypothetical protein
MARIRSAAAPTKPTHQPRPALYTRALANRGNSGSGPLYPTTPVEPPPSPGDLPQGVSRELQQPSPYHYSPSPYSEGALTPGSTISSGPLSRTVSPCLTTSSLAVEYQHHLSPLVVPTSDIEQHPGFVYLNQTPHIPGHAQCPPQHYGWYEQQDTGLLTPPESTSSSLAGINASPETDSYVRQRVEFISPTGPTPTQIQHYPRVAGPWTGQQLRQDDVMVLDHQSPPGSSNGSAFSPSQERGSRRLGPLTVDQRKNANLVREKGACLRCSCMKEKCDAGFPCNNCQGKKGRKWKLGCIRDTLYKRADLLFPTKIAQRYDMAKTSGYVHDSAFCYSEGDVFMLNLKIGLGGPPLRVPVKEMEPLKSNRQLTSFQANTQRSGNNTVDSWDPPIVLYTTDKNQFVAGLIEQLKASQQYVFTERHTNGFWWPYKFFEMEEMDWMSEVVEKIHEFQQTSNNMPFYSSIYKAQSLLYFSYIIDHTFLVDGDEDRRILFTHLSSPPQGTVPYINPEQISRPLKSIAYPFLVRYSTELLKELHDLLLKIAKAKEPSRADHDLAFCLSFMMLVFISATQSRIVMLKELTKTEPEINISETDCKEFLQTIETDVATYVIQFHEFATKKRRKSSPSPAAALSPFDVEMGGMDPNMNLFGKPAEEQHALRFNLMGCIEDIMQSHRAYYNLYYHHQPQSASFSKVNHGQRKKNKNTDPLPWTAGPNFKRPNEMGVPKPDVTQFEVQNMHQLCWRFMEIALAKGD